MARRGYLRGVLEDLLSNDPHAPRVDELAEAIEAADLIRVVWDLAHIVARRMAATGHPPAALIAEHRRITADDILPAYEYPTADDTYDLMLAVFAALIIGHDQAPVRALLEWVLTEENGEARLRHLIEGLAVHGRAHADP